MSSNLVLSLDSSRLYSMGSYKSERLNIIIARILIELFLDKFDSTQFKLMNNSGINSTRLVKLVCVVS